MVEEEILSKEYQCSQIRESLKWKEQQLLKKYGNDFKLYKEE